MAVKQYMCEITEVNGEFEYPSKFLMECEEDQIEVKFTEVFRTFRGDGEFEGEDFVWYDFATAGKDPYCIEIPAEDFQVLKKYLTVL